MATVRAIVAEKALVFAAFEFNVSFHVGFAAVPFVARRARMSALI